jgi:hypothetical protein
MSWVAVAVGAVGAGLSAYGSYAANKKASNPAGVPQAAEFKPINFSDVQRDAVTGNLHALPDIETLANSTNDFITAQSLKRANKFILNYTASMGIYANAGQSLL